MWNVQLKFFYMGSNLKQIDNTQIIDHCIPNLWSLHSYFPCTDSACSKPTS